MKEEALKNITLLLSYTIKENTQLEPEMFEHFMEDLPQPMSLKQELDLWKVCNFIVKHVPG